MVNRTSGKIGAKKEGWEDGRSTQQNGCRRKVPIPNNERGKGEGGQATRISLSCRLKYIPDERSYDKKKSRGKKKRFHMVLARKIIRGAILTAEKESPMTQQLRGN